MKKSMVVLVVMILLCVSFVFGAYECTDNNECNRDEGCFYDYICIGYANENGEKCDPDDNCGGSCEECQDGRPYDCYIDDNWDVGESSSVIEDCGKYSHYGLDYECNTECTGSFEKAKPKCATGYTCDTEHNTCEKPCKMGYADIGSRVDEGPGEDIDGDGVTGEDDVIICDDTCGKDDDCASGYECYGTECKEVCEGVSEGYLDYFGYDCSYEYDYCKDNSQCAENYYCNSLNHCVETGTPLAYVINRCASKDCLGYDCEGGTCLTSCTNGGDCDADSHYYCDTLTSQCVASCSPYGVNNYGSCFTSCVDNTYCASGYACGSNLVCSLDSDADGIADADDAVVSTSTRGNAVAGESCIVDSDCADTYTCDTIKGVCVQYCTVTECSDGIDNDNDGYTDYTGSDPQCRSPLDTDESSNPQCADFTYAADSSSIAYDNDGDGYANLEDCGCSSPEDDDESDCSGIQYAPETEGFFSKWLDFLIFWN